MQWFIDMILGLAKTYTDTTCAAVAGGPGFVDRGDPAGPDFQAGDLICNNAWHDMDLSAIVPADSSAVVLRITLIDNLIATGAAFRKKGNINWPNVAYVSLFVNGMVNTVDKIVAVDNDRFCQYLVNVVPDIIQITVAGWFGPEP